MNLKQLAAARAVEAVQSGMVLGLGTGSTTRYAIEMIGERLRDGRLRDIAGVPTSSGTVQLARQVGVPITTLQEHPVLDLTIDGADEVWYSPVGSPPLAVSLRRAGTRGPNGGLCPPGRTALPRGKDQGSPLGTPSRVLGGTRANGAPLRRGGPDLVLIKGQGGALLHEKIVARASREEIIIVDESKLVQVLGTKSPLAVEVIPFGWGTYLDALRDLGCEPVLRMHGGTPYITDEGNCIVDCRFPRIDDPVTVERELNLIPGVVDNGLFIGLATLIVVASESGIRELRPRLRRDAVAALAFGETR